MKKKVVISIILFAGFILILVITKLLNTSQYTSYLPVPNAINLYYNGEEKQILKNSGLQDWNGEDLFKTICKSVIFKMPDEISAENSSFLSETSDEIMEAKKDAVGFYYNKPKKISAYNGALRQIQYTEILVVLNGEYRDNIYIRMKDKSYLFIGARNNLVYLNKNYF